ncbi:MFS transporter [Subtercola boreus]|uniref:Bcr/CflA family drug resistance efflux transporter n=1 Tax=Subtercola boreus TaxID=120213 RepID=A0A3E0W613_9MICO|nr:MFS transporter [Subtercola boreus]RFA17963.1 Bcr/CflA family drug resistance efflux transporter [Subtercola boreus]RFA18345.1 Bcr/CflA family drug resistance efflux transporter [Subtercola boreus]RFA24874.1 Bcr/CflA family drug resistance efflux transporter [Subtercola boreus]
MDVAPAPAATKRSNRLLLVILLAIIPLSQVPIDIYTPAIPTMVTDLGASNTLVQNTVSAYVLGMSVGLLPIGIIADARGRKPTLLVCLALLLVTSVGCALTADVYTLLGMRFLQGLGGCSTMVIVYAIAADRFRGARLTSISGLLGASWGLAPVMAPAIGGLLVEYISWRGIFVAVAVAALAAGVAVALLLPETLAKDGRTPIDLREVGGVLASTLRRRIFIALTLVFAVFAVAQLLFGVVAPLLYEVQLGFSPALYGGVALLVGAANLAGELSTAHFATRVPARVLAFTALGFFGAGAIILCLSGVLVGPSLLWITLGGMLALAGCGALCPLAYGLTLGYFDRNLGLVGGLTSAICYLFVAVTMAAAAGLPDDSQAPIGFVYVGVAVAGLVLLSLCLPRRRSSAALSSVHANA